MKLLYISTSIIPSRTANSIHVMKMCHALSRVGCRVTLVAPDMDKQRSTSLFSYYGVEENFEIVKLYWARFKGRGLIYAVLASLIARREKVDLVYSRNLMASYFSALLNAPVIHESHTPIEDKGKLAKFFFSRLIKKKAFKGLVVITKALEVHFLKHYAELNDFTQVAPDGADPWGASVTPVLLGEMQRGFNAGYVGHLYAGKGMELIAKVANLCPEINFHIVGGLKEDIAKWRKKCSELSNVVFHGYVPHAKVPSYMESFDVLLLPNQIEVLSYHGGSEIGKWTSPLKAFEYMASGKMIISSDLPVLREVLEDEVNCWLCSPDSAEEWSEALEKVKNNPEIADEIGRRSKQIFLEKYTWEARARSVLVNVKAI